MCLCVCVSVSLSVSVYEEFLKSQLATQLNTLNDCRTDYAGGFLIHEKIHIYIFFYIRTCLYAMTQDFLVCHDSDLRMCDVGGLFDSHICAMTHDSLVCHDLRRTCVP